MIIQNSSCLSDMHAEKNYNEYADSSSRKEKHLMRLKWDMEFNCSFKFNREEFFYNEMILSNPAEVYYHDELIKGYCSQYSDHSNMNGLPSNIDNHQKSITSIIYLSAILRLKKYL